MKREFLKSLGLTDEIADKVIAEHGKDVQTANSKIATAEQERDSYKEQITERDKQLKELNDNSGNNKELQEQIKQLQEDNKTASSKYQTELANVQKDNAIKLALKDSKAKDADMVFRFPKLFVSVSKFHFMQARDNKNPQRFQFIGDLLNDTHFFAKQA